MSPGVGWGWGETAPGRERLFYQTELNPLPQDGWNAASGCPLVLSLFPSPPLFFIYTHTTPTLPLPPK